MRGSSVKGSVQFYDIALTVNLTSLTIEQVIGKRKKMLLDMGAGIDVEVQDATFAEGLATKEGLDFLKLQLNKVCSALGKLGVLPRRSAEALCCTLSPRGCVSSPLRHS